jgi:hypothetical protein
MEGLWVKAENRDLNTALRLGEQLLLASLEGGCGSPRHHYISAGLSCPELGSEGFNFISSLIFKF